MISIRRAQVLDAEAMGALYVRVWQDVYPGVIPNETLLAMCPDRAAERWEAAILAEGGRRGALVAEDVRGGIVAIGNYGPNRDRSLPYEGEIFTLYVDPDRIGGGTGSMLLTAMFEALTDAGMGSALVWTLSLSPHRFFYEAVGAKLIARKMDRIAGMPVELSAFGWADIAARLDGAVPELSASRTNDYDSL